MNLINNTPCPALAFYGIDQQEQEFHVIVTRQTYTWNDAGLLVLAEDQDALCMMDQLVDPDDIMSGVIEESDLCHFKPKCDVLIKGYAYAPDHRKNEHQFTARIKLKTPDKIIYDEKQNQTKYAFIKNQSVKEQVSNDSYIEGDTLINKTLSVLSPRSAVHQGVSLTGNIHYSIKPKDMSNKVSLNPSSSFGGYCFIEESNPVINNINYNELIPEEDRDALQLKQASGPIAYYAQDSHNPSGRGSYPNIYHHAIKPKSFKLPQIHSPNYTLTEKHLEQMANDQIDPRVHQKLINGFGVRSKSHPDRVKYAGTLDQHYIESGKSLPDDFDFAIWNSAYPDQIVDEIKGDEWLILTNLCRADTIAAINDDAGDTILTLYLPETLTYLVVVPVDDNEMAKPSPTIKIDTLVISPDEQKINIVWRSIIKADNAPQHLMLEMMNREEKEVILSQHFAQKGEVVRPYLVKTNEGSAL